MDRSEVKKISLILGGGGFSAKVLVSKLKFDQMYIYLLEMTELCIKKHFEDVKIPYLVLNSK